MKVSHLVNERLLPRELTRFVPMTVPYLVWDFHKLDFVAERGSKRPPAMNKKLPPRPALSALPLYRPYLPVIVTPYSWCRAGCRGFVFRARPSSKSGVSERNTAQILVNTATAPTPSFRRT
jgi:hypothetical protein